MPDNLLKSQAFKLKGRLFTLTVMQIIETNNILFADNLADVVAKAPRLFDRTPVVLDCSGIDGDKLDLQFITQCLHENGLILVAIQGGTPFLETVAHCQGLAVFNASSHQDRPLEADARNHEPVQPAVVETIKSKLLTTPVRSGQQVVSKGGDLVITAAVSHGAELLSDGNIHVYGALRGRALAGIAGDKQARIFCQSLDAELLSIAGFYRLSDAIEPFPGPCQIFLQDDHIQIEPL